MADRRDTACALIPSLQIELRRDARDGLDIDITCAYGKMSRSWMPRFLVTYEQSPLAETGRGFDGGETPHGVKKILSEISATMAGGDIHVYDLDLQREIDWTVWRVIQLETAGV